LTPAPEQKEYKMINTKRYLSILTVLVTSLLIVSCAGQQTRSKSSVVDYLYPSQSETVVQPSIPVLNIPVKVGIAFVPEQATHSRNTSIWAGPTSARMLTENTKRDLLEKIATHFRQQKYVGDIEIIPSAYLTPGGSFANLDQIRTMYGVDVIALVSYDQVQFTDEGMLSLTYWTLVGAYVVSGEKNDTNTMLDTAVYDIKSRKMLFRAPGTSIVKGSSTPVNLSEELRADSIKGFQEATVQMISNLDLELSEFEKKIKARPEEFRVVHQEGGGGAFGPIELLFMSLGLAALWYRKRSGDLVAANPEKQPTQGSFRL
jgi:rhombotail lipoprotein